jgi:hypothetical protein
MKGKPNAHGNWCGDWNQHIGKIFLDEVDE